MKKKYLAFLMAMVITCSQIGGTGVSFVQAEETEPATEIYLGEVSEAKSETITETETETESETVAATEIEME